MKKDDWRNSQSLLQKHFKHFKHLGFDRGEVKNTNKKDHKEKLDYVRDLAYQVKKLKQTNRKCETKNLILLNDKLDLMDEIEEAKGRLKSLDTAKEAVENIAKVLRKKGMYQSVQKLIPKPVFDYFSGKAQIIYLSLTGKYFKLKETETAQKSIASQTIKNNICLEQNLEMRNEELEKIRNEIRSEAIIDTIKPDRIIRKIRPK